MTQIKTAEQIAQDVMDANMDFDGTGSYGPDVEVPVEIIFNMITEAIEADRALREVQAAGRDYRNGFDNTVAAALYDCLTDRETEEAARAAEWVAENENGELWDRFIGPMLDEMEKEYGR